jgi:3alpha(or 20beta)-hydroxysteroid dehydrogenase
MGRVEGKVALISGAARGMGAEDARALVREGAHVVIGDVRSDEGSQVAKELGDAARFVQLDVTVPEHWDSAVETAEREFGRLDILVNNAGIAHWGTIEEYPLEDWRRALDVNLTGAFLGIKAAIPALKRSGGGSIVNISSLAGLRGSHSRSGYTASKFGLRGLTKSAALDLGQYGIRVNSVHPGAVNTPFLDGMEVHLPKPGTGVALGRRAEAHELAQLVLFLASDESSYCTGAEFIADGGTMAGVAPEREVPSL